MLSECAKAASAEEALYRVDYSNSTPRAIKVISLDEPSERALRRLARLPWNRATFMTALYADQFGKHGAQSVRGWLSDLAGHTVDLLDQIKSADLVVTVSTAGENSEIAGTIADACNLHHVMTTALIIEPASRSDKALLKTLIPLRPHASMLVVANGEEYVEAMLVALRA